MRVNIYELAKRGFLARPTEALRIATSQNPTEKCVLQIQFAGRIEPLCSLHPDYGMKEVNFAIFSLISSTEMQQQAKIPFIC